MGEWSSNMQAWPSLDGLLDTVLPVAHYLSSPSSTPTVSLHGTCPLTCHSVSLCSVDLDILYSCFLFPNACSSFYDVIKRDGKIFYRADCKVNYGQQVIADGHIFRRIIFIHKYMSDML